MHDILRVGIALLIAMFIIFVFQRGGEKFVGAGTDLGAGSGSAYNSGANMRKKSYSEDNLGEYIKGLEQREVEFVNRRNTLSRFDWSSAMSPTQQNDAQKG
jgi:hypothetical protein